MDMELVMVSCAADGMNTTVSYIERSGEPLVRSVRRVGFAAMRSMALDQCFESNDGQITTQAMYQNMWAASGIGPLLIRPAPFTAPKIDAWDPIISYTTLWNLSDYPAAIVPEGKVGAEGTVDESTRDVPVTVQFFDFRQEHEHFALVVGEVDRVLKAKIHGTLRDQARSWTQLFHLESSR